MGWISLSQQANIIFTRHSWHCCCKEIPHSKNLHNGNTQIKVKIYSR